MLSGSQDFGNGYEQTKWVADKMVWHAIQAGYPASIYRLGMLSGVAESGWTCNGFAPVTYLIMPPWLQTRMG